jgi:anti-sigma factor (TIGR02949 family)
VTCSEALELLPAAVDGRIGEDLLHKLNHHFGTCTQCLHEFELERITKSVVRKHSRPTRSPEHLKTRIQNELNRERNALAGAGIPPKQQERKGLMGWPVFVLTGAGAVILLLLVVTTPLQPKHHTHTQPVDGDIVHQTYNNFDGVLDGKLRPEVVSDDPKVVKAFFSPMVDFDVQIPEMKKFKLIGAMCSQYDGRCIAQLVYKGNKDVVYLYEVNLRTALRAEHGARLTAKAANQLLQTGWYVESHVPDCSLAMWVKDSTLCCAIADVNKDLLLASLTEPH